jgi:hypothetical protein
MNRDQRRAMKARADRLGPLFARTCFTHRHDGEIELLTATSAVSVLARAFTGMLRNGFAPQVLRLTEEQAKAFPTNREPIPPDAQPWLAVGLDVNGLGTYVLRYLKPAGQDPASHRRCAEAVMLMELIELTTQGGLPRVSGT